MAAFEPGKMEGLDAITDDLRQFFSKINYMEIAHKYYK